jgi:hypothetical protein
LNWPTSVGKFAIATRSTESGRSDQGHAGAAAAVTSSFKAIALLKTFNQLSCAGAR